MIINTDVAFRKNHEMLSQHLLIAGRITSPGRLLTCWEGEGNYCSNIDHATAQLLLITSMRIPIAHERHHDQNHRRKRVKKT